ncbi:MAG TPA: chromate resistance protein ChrB domain-containing protein [Rhodanobacteraceae bacterium]|jgi:hypothetical protein|nr:chromate resistance protein ChrB domain-containing protein [Rhodanobacteraceae bacterium]
MSDSRAWLMLVNSVSGENKTARMRIWRALKASGAAALRDGVYVLPRSDGARTLFAGQAEEVVAAGGTAHILALDGEDEAQQGTLVRLFDRGADYEKLFARLDAFNSTIARFDEVEARRQAAALRREVAALVAIDFFPGAARHQVESVLADCEAALNARFSPDEPHPAKGAIAPRDRTRYRGRTWATRQHPWIDRVASAWLIRRFIDPKAKFLWLKRPKDCPKSAVGFDFDGAEFTHVGARVTFEVLAASFGLDKDRAIARIGAMVHYLDVGGIVVPEAAGFAAIMAGARAQQPDDDKLLKGISAVLDALYAGYKELPGGAA